MTPSPEHRQALLTPAARRLPMPSDDRPRRRRAVVPQFDVVAIGASAGGVEALHAVVGALPGDFPVPVLIVQHMDPRHKSMLAGLLGRRCKLRVKQAANDEAIQAATVYIAPPDMHL